MPQTMNIAGELNIKINGTSVFLLTSAGLTLSALDGTPIGATTPAAITGTTITATTSVTTPSLTNAGTLALAATGSNIITVSTASTEAFRVTSAQKTIFGGTTLFLLGADSWSPDIQNQGTQGISTLRAGDDAYGGALNLASARGTVGTPAVVQTGDRLGGIYFSGYDGTDFQNYGAAIEAYVDGTPGANDMPGRLVLSVVADGANTLSSAIIIENDLTVDFRKAGTAASVAANFSAANYITAKVAGTTVYIPYSTSTW